MLLDLPEELLLAILSHLDTHDLLDASRICRQLNRLTVPQAMLRFRIPDPTSHCKLALSPTTELVDSLNVLARSVYVRHIRDLSFYFTAFPQYTRLAAPLRRVIGYLESCLDSVDEITLHFAPQTIPDGLKDEKSFKELISLFETLLNTIVLRSTKTLRLLGSTGLLSQYYAFNPDSKSSDALPPTGFISKFLPSTPSRGALKDYLDRRAQKNSPDPVVRADLRYTRTSLAGSRLFLRPAPAALQTPCLTLINLGTTDFLRPPFSQWLFPVLRASPVESVSFCFGRIPRRTGEYLDGCSALTEEGDGDGAGGAREKAFMLQRLAAALPKVTRLCAFEMSLDAIPALVKWANMFPLLERLQVEPFDIGEWRLFGESTKGGNTFEWKPARETTARHFDVPPVLHACPGRSPMMYSFAATLRHVDGPCHFLSYFFDLAWKSYQAAATTTIATPTDEALQSFPTHGTTTTPRLPAPAANSEHNPIFPALNLVHFDYDVIKGSKFSIDTLARAVEIISTTITHSPSTSAGDRPVGYQRTSTTGVTPSILVHLDFGVRFSELFEAEAQVEAARAALANAEEPAASHNLPQPNASPPPPRTVPPLDPNTLHTLSTIKKVRLTLPGTKRHVIVEGASRRQILAILAVFPGCAHLRLVCQGGAGAGASSMRESVVGELWEKCKERSGGVLKRVEVDVVRTRRGC